MEFAHDIRRCPSDTVEAARQRAECARTSRTPVTSLKTFLKYMNTFRKYGPMQMSDIPVSVIFRLIIVNSITHQSIIHHQSNITTSPMLPLHRYRPTVQMAALWHHQNTDTGPSVHMPRTTGRPPSRPSSANFHSRRVYRHFTTPQRKLRRPLYLLSPTCLRNPAGPKQVPRSPI